MDEEIRVQSRNQLQAAWNALEEWSRFSVEDCGLDPYQQIGLMWQLQHQIAAIDWQRSSEPGPEDLA